LYQVDLFRENTQYIVEAGTGIEPVYTDLQSAEGGGFSEHPVSVYARVTEVRFSPDGDAEIVFASGDTTMVEAVNGLREAASPPRE